MTNKVIIQTQPDELSERLQKIRAKQTLGIPLTEREEAMLTLYGKKETKHGR